MFSRGSARRIGHSSVSPRASRGRRRRAWIWRLSLSALLVAALTTALVPGASSRPRAHAAAACLQWDVTGTWQTVQSNVYRVTWALATGDDSFRLGHDFPGRRCRTEIYGHRGNDHGRSLVGDRLDVVVQWPVRTDGVVVRGRYAGTVTQGAQSGQGQSPMDWRRTLRIPAPQRALPGPVRPPALPSSDPSASDRASCSSARHQLRACRQRLGTGWDSQRGGRAGRCGGAAIAADLAETTRGDHLCRGAAYPRDNRRRAADGRLLPESFPEKELSVSEKGLSAPAS